MSPTLNITAKELREALDHWLQERFVRYPPRYRVGSVMVKRPRTKRRFILKLVELPRK